LISGRLTFTPSHDLAIIRNKDTREDSPSRAKSTERRQKHTTGGIPRWSPTLVLVARFSAYVWQSGRDAQFSLTYGRMCLLLGYWMLNMLTLPSNDQVRPILGALTATDGLRLTSVLPLLSPSAVQEHEPIVECIRGSTDRVSAAVATRLLSPQDTFCRTVHHRS
jgi:hypothetical protein